MTIKTLIVFLVSVAVVFILTLAAKAQNITSPELQARYKKNLALYDRDNGDWALQAALQSPDEPALIPNAKAETVPTKVAEADKIRWNSAIHSRDILLNRKDRSDEDNARIKAAEDEIKSFATKYSPPSTNAPVTINPTPRDTPGAPDVYKVAGLLSNPFSSRDEINPDYAAWKINQLKDASAQLQQSPALAPTLSAKPKKKPLIYIEGSPLSNATRAEADARWNEDFGLKQSTPDAVVVPKSKIRRWNPKTGTLE